MKVLDRKTRCDKGGNEGKKVVATQDKEQNRTCAVHSYGCTIRKKKVRCLRNRQCTVKNRRCSNGDRKLEEDSGALEK
jgi:hypothetical protein